MVLGMSSIMPMNAARSSGRPRGNIEERGGKLRVRLYAGIDPVTGRQSYLRETIPGTDKAAWKKAEAKLAEFQTQVAKQRSAQSSVDLRYALAEWRRTSELEDSTRHTYEGYINRTILPALGDTAISKLTARSLEGFYTELRRCRARCQGKPYIEKHKTSGKHDCAVAASPTPASRWARRPCARSTPSSAALSTPPCDGTGSAPTQRA